MIEKCYDFRIWHHDLCNILFNSIISECICETFMKTFHGRKIGRLSFNENIFDTHAIYKCKIKILSYKIFLKM